MATATRKFIPDTGQSPVATVVVTRLPILDRTHNLLGYELLVHGTSNDRDEGDAESMRIRAHADLMHAFVDLGVERLVGKAEAFMRLPRASLGAALALPIAGAHMVIGIDCSSPIDYDTLVELSSLRRKGFRLALEDPPLGDVDPLLLGAVEMAQYAKFRMSGSLGAAAVQAMRQRGMRVIATQIDTHEQMQRAVAIGCDGFEGCYLSEPEVVVGSSLRENKLSVLRLLAAIEDPTKGPVELDAIIRTDAALSYKVLRCVNSASFSLPLKVRSVLHATVYLGVDRIRSWIRMIAISGLQQCPTELLKFALIRGRMCELLATKLSNDQREMAFTVGLFSLLDALLNAPLEELLARIPVAEDIREALLRQRGPLATLLDAAKSCERGDWQRLEASSVPTAQCAGAYVDAVEWAENVFEVGGDARPA